jgi:hypothetical protein
LKNGPFLFKETDILARYFPKYIYIYIYIYIHTTTRNMQGRVGIFCCCRETRLTKI